MAIATTPGPTLLQYTPMSSLRNGLKSPQTSMYYSLQVMQGTRRLKMMHWLHLMVLTSDTMFGFDDNA